MLYIYWARHQDEMHPHKNGIKQFASGDHTTNILFPFRPTQSQRSTAKILTLRHSNLFFTCLFASGCHYCAVLDVLFSHCTVIIILKRTAVQSVLSMASSVAWYNVDTSLFPTGHSSGSSTPQRILLSCLA